MKTYEPKVYRFKKNYKIPFLDRSILEGTDVQIVGKFTGEEDLDKVKICIVGVPRHDTQIPFCEISTVWGIKKEYLFI